MVICEFLAIQHALGLCTATLFSIKLTKRPSIKLTKSITEKYYLGLSIKNSNVGKHFLQQLLHLQTPRLPKEAKKNFIKLSLY